VGTVNDLVPVPIAKEVDEVVVNSSPSAPEVPELPLEPLVPLEPELPDEPLVPFVPELPDDPLEPDDPLVPFVPGAASKLIFHDDLVPLPVTDVTFTVNAPETLL